MLLTASGPRFLELAGEVADGALMLVGLHPDSVAAARERLAAGASRTGRDPEQLREIFYRAGGHWCARGGQGVAASLVQAGTEVARVSKPLKPSLAQRGGHRAVRKSRPEEHL